MIWYVNQNKSVRVKGFPSGIILSISPTVETETEELTLRGMRRLAERTVANGQPCVCGIFRCLTIRCVILVLSLAVRVLAPAFSYLITSANVYSHVRLEPIFVGYERHSAFPSVRFCHPAFWITRK